MCNPSIFCLSIDSLVKLSFKHKGDDVPSNCCGFDVEQQESDDPIVEDPSDDDLEITATFSDAEVPDLEMSEDEIEEENANIEERLIQFNVDSDVLNTLCGLLSPQLPNEVFLMYLVCLQYISFFTK